MPTIYSVKSDYLLKDADEIERSAKESLKTWILLGQTEKYSEAMRLVRALRDAAETRSLYTRRKILRNAGFSIKSPKQTAKDIQGQTRKANPMKKPTPAQLAARARFAEMARSGAFKRKAKRNPAPVKMKIRGSETPDNPEGIIVTEAGALRFAKQNMPADLKRAGFVPSVVAGARGWSINYGAPVPGHSSYSRNPAKKTVSQKISQLVHEGYPQKQAVAVALSEQRKGKVKRNPATGRKGSRTKLNPMAAPVQVSSDSMFKYAVEAKRSLGSAGAVFETVAAFHTKLQAKDYAKAILAAHPNVTLRIKTYARQK